MSLSYQMFGSARGATCYRSFLGYRIPPQLQGPIPFRVTEDLASFYLARHEEGRLLWVAKILVESQDLGWGRLAEARRPGARFFVAPGVGSDAYDLARPISYPETKGRVAYFQIQVGADGFEGQAELLIRKVVFADFYTYGPGGRLRQRKLVREDEGYTVWRYDDRGKVCEQSTAAADGISPAERELLQSDGTGPTEGQPPEPDARAIDEVMVRFLGSITPDTRPRGLDEAVLRLRHKFARRGWYLSEQEVKRVLFEQLGRRRGQTEEDATLDVLRDLIKADLRNQGLNPSDFIRDAL
jgi:hypothetical protein